MSVVDPDDDFETDNTDEIDEEVKELMIDYDLDPEEAGEVKDIMDEYGLDEDEAIELKDVL